MIFYCAAKLGTLECPGNHVLIELKEWWDELETFKAFGTFGTFRAFKGLRV